MSTINDAQAAERIREFGAGTVGTTEEREWLADAARPAGADLAALQRRIRAVAIAALANGELGGDYEQNAARVERFLTDLGLDALPRARRIRAVVGLGLRVRANTGELALDATAQTMRCAARPDEAWPCIDSRWFAEAPAEVEPGVWLVRWRNVYDVWLSGYPAGAAIGPARAAVEAELSRMVAGLEVEAMDITCTDEGLRIDEFLDPEID